MTTTVKRVVKYKDKYFKLVEDAGTSPDSCASCVFENPGPSVHTDGCEELGGRCHAGVFRRATEKEYLLAKLQGIES